MTTKVALIVVLFATSTASARWVNCPSCTPPTGIVSGLSSLPLYKGNVKFGGEVKVSGVPMWVWLRVDPPPTCTPAQLINPDDRLYGCGAKVGEPLMRTMRVKNVP